MSVASNVVIVAIAFTLGARTLFAIPRRLHRRALTLEEALAAALPQLPPLPGDAHGYFLGSVPDAGRHELAAAEPGLRPFVRQAYERYYAAIDGSFEDYLGGFSARSRSTLRRKVRRFAEAGGGAVDLRCYRTPAEMGEFQYLAGALSARTYQQKRLGIGLPAGPEALARMQALAARDSVRGWILRLGERPAAFLLAPAEGSSLLYGHVGYEPELAPLSPGIVLKFEAIRQLFAERRFARIDFTEGEGQHKRQFATASVPCSDLLLLRPTLPNLAIGHALGWFDAAVAGARRAAERIGVAPVARRVLR